MVRPEVLGTAVGIVLIGVAHVFVDFVWFFGVWIRGCLLLSSTFNCGFFINYMYHYYMLD